ncbi:heme-binding protein [Methylobacterium oryzae CBMB20]
MDRVMYALVTLAEAVLGIFGVRTLYEQPAYTVVERLDRGVEIRSYAPRLAVETDARGQGDGDAFGRLFRYITGANRAGDRIAMTAPVESGGQRVARHDGPGGAGRKRHDAVLPAARRGGCRGARADRARGPAGRDPGRADRGPALLRPPDPEARAAQARILAAVLAAAGRTGEGAPFVMRVRPALRDPVPAPERGRRPPDAAVRSRPRPASVRVGRLAQAAPRGDRSGAAGPVAHLSR